MRNTVEVCREVRESTDCLMAEWDRKWEERMADLDEQRLAISRKIAALEALTHLGRWARLMSMLRHGQWHDSTVVASRKAIRQDVAWHLYLHRRDLRDAEWDRKWELAKKGA